MGLLDIVNRIKARLRRRPAVVERRGIPQVELFELWEGANDDALLEVLDDIRHDLEEDAEEMQEAYRQLN